MIRIQIQGLMLLIGCLSSLYSSPQVPDPTHAKGKVIIQKSPNLTIPGISKPLADKLRSGMEVTRDVALQDSLIKYPVGFSVNVDMSATNPSNEIPWQKQRMGSVHFDLSDLYLE